MKRLAFSLLLLIVPAVLAQDKLTLKEETPYFPLKEGSIWTYSAAGRTFTTKVTGYEKSGDDVCARLETRREKDLISSELVTVRKDGVFRVEFSGTKFVPAVCFLKLPVKKDDSWKIESKVGGGTQETKSEFKGSFKFGESKSIKVKGTTYDTISVIGEMKFDGQNTTVTYYFAENVGMVKQTIVIGTTTVELELEKYELK
jgi:hypothetical protein